MNLSTREIVVVQIGFRFLIIFDFASEGRGSKSAHFWGIFFRHNTLLGNILLNDIPGRTKDGFFHRSFILYKSEGAGPLKKGPRRVQSI